jgi:hypothetical protein
MRLASLLAGTVLATALATSAFAGTTKFSLTFTAKGTTLCTMALNLHSDGLLAGTGCGTAFDVGFAELSGKKVTGLVIAGADNTTPEGWAVDLKNKTFVLVITTDGKSVTAETGKVTVGK